MLILGTHATNNGREKRKLFHRSVNAARRQETMSDGIRDDRFTAIRNFKIKKTAIEGEKTAKPNAEGNESARENAGFVAGLLNASKTALNFALLVVNPFIIAGKFILKPKLFVESVKNARKSLKECEEGIKGVNIALAASEIASHTAAYSVGATLLAAGFGAAAIGGWMAAADYTAAILVFQGVFFSKYWKAYKHEFKTDLKTFIAIEKDLLAMQVRGFGWAALSYSVSVGSLLGISEVTNSTLAGLLTNMAITIPNMLAFMAVMSVFLADFYPVVSRKAENYAKSLQEKEGAPKA